MKDIESMRQIAHEQVDTDWRWWAGKWLPTTVGKAVGKVKRWYTRTAISLPTTVYGRWAGAERWASCPLPTTTY